MDAPLPPNLQSVEVRVVLKTQQQGDVSSLIRLIESFPPGTRSQEEIDAEIEEGRADSPLVRLYLDTNPLICAVEGSAAIQA